MRDYENEAFLAWYRKPTVGWLELSMAARGLLVSIAMELNPKTGELYLRKGLASLAILLRCSWEDIEVPIGELVAAGKLEWDGAKFMLRDPDYDARKRRTSADRMREKRERERSPSSPPPPPVTCDASDARDVTPVTGGVGDACDGTSLLFSSCSSSISEGEHEREGGAEARYREAYCAGIREGKGGGFVWPNVKQAQWDLNGIVAEFCKAPSGKAYKGEQLLQAITHNAREFARDVTKRDEAKFYSAYSPRGCAKWLAEVDRAEEARRVG